MPSLRDMNVSSSIVINNMAYNGVYKPLQHLNIESIKTFFKEFTNHYSILTLNQSRHSSNAYLTNVAFMRMNRLLFSLWKQHNTKNAKGEWVKEDLQDTKKKYACVNTPK